VDRGTAGFVRRLLGQTIGQQKQNDQGDCGIESILLTRKAYTTYATRATDVTIRRSSPS